MLKGERSLNYKVYAIVALIVLVFSTSICAYTGRALPQNGVIEFPATRIFPDIDGILEPGEWADANVVDISSGNLTGYLSIKCDSQFLYLLVESINDTTPPVTYRNENTWVAIDTLDNGGTAPQPDDYLFNTEYSWAVGMWRGNGSSWTNYSPLSGYYAVQVFTNSSFSNSTHLVNEIRIPLSLLGDSAQNGFYVGVCDSNMQRNIEWPTGAGVTWDWWPPSTGSFPAPNLWGSIEFPTEPVAIIDYSPADPVFNESITFYGGLSYDVLGSIVDYSWDFGAGTNASGVTAFHTYPSPGTYPVMLNVTDNDGLSDFVVRNVTVYSSRPNYPPVADFTWSPSIPKIGENVIFNGSYSYDPDGWIVSYNWDLGDGTKMDGSVVSHAFFADGSYDVSLTVTDNKSASSTSVKHFTVLTDWSSDTRLTEDSAHDHSPSIMQTEEGTIWIAWNSERIGRNELYYATSSDGGATWTNDTRLTNSSSSEDMKPSVMQASDGTIWVVWSSSRLGNPSTYNVYYKTSDDNGSSWSSDTLLTAEIGEDPSVMQASDGTIWVIWSSNRGDNIDLYYATSSDGGATWTNDTRLTDHPDSDVAPSVMQASDGTIWVVWSSNRDGPLNVYYKTSVDNGSSWSSDTPLVQDAHRDNTPSFVQTFDGTVWVVWSSNRWDLEEDMLFYKASSDGGATWTDDTRITFVTGPNRIDMEPSVMQASGGTLWVAWASDRIPSGIEQWGQFEIFYKTKLPPSPPPEPDLIAPPLTAIPTIDGNWSGGEWDDAFEYAISNGSLTSYVLVKWGAGNVTGDFLYILIDSPWDTIPPQLNPNENYWVAFDTLGDGGAVPQPDDYLFNDGFSDWNGLSWQGDGGSWTFMLTPKPKYAATQNINGTSPHSSTGHTICESRIPLTHVGPVGSTVGFYMLAIDDSADPTGDYNPPGSPRYVEYPYGAGGNSSGWPPDLNPTPAPSAWGTLKLAEASPPLARIHVVSVGEEEFEIATLSNSSITAFQLNVTTKTLSFNVTGTDGTAGFCNVSIPADLLWGDFFVYKDGSLLLRDTDYIEAYNGTHYTFCITYTHTTHTIEIKGTEVIPEFPGVTIPLLFMLFALIAVALEKKIRCKVMTKTT